MEPTELTATDAAQMIWETESMYAIPLIISQLAPADLSELQHVVASWPTEYPDRDSAGDEEC